MWYPWKGVEVETWLIPPTPETPLWHIRVHRIKTDRDLLTAEGGFAIHGQGNDKRALEPSTGEDYGTLESGAEARATSKAGVSGIVALTDSSRKGKALRTDANSNLMVPRAVLPTLLGEHKPGTDWLFTGVFALPAEGDGVQEQGAKPGWEAEWKKRPVVPGDITQA
jgi:hypothetical protein